LTADFQPAETAAILEAAVGGFDAGSLCVAFAEDGGCLFDAAGGEAASLVGERQFEATVLRLVDRAELQQRARRAGGHLDHGRVSGLIACDAPWGVAGRAGFDRARFFVMGEVVERQRLRVHVRSATGHGGDPFDSEGLGEQHVFVAAIGRVGGYLSGDQTVGGELFQHGSHGVRVIRVGRFGDRADDERHVVVGRARLAQLDLIALSFMAVVGRIRVGRILNHVVVGLREDDDAALDDLALLLKDLHQRRVRRAAVDLGAVGETFDHQQHVLGDLLLRACPSRRVPGLGEQPTLRRRVPCPQLLGQRRVVVRHVTPDLRETPLHRHRHQLHSAKRRHVTEDVRAVQSLLRNVQFQQVRQRDRQFGKDPRREIVVREQLPITFHRPVGTLGPRLDVQRERHIGPHHVGVGGVHRVPVEKVGQEHQPGHRMQLLGVTSRVGREVLDQFPHRQQLHHHRAKETLPPRKNALPSHPRQHPLKRVKYPCFSRITNQSHHGHIAL